MHDVLHAVMTFKINALQFAWYFLHVYMIFSRHIRCHARRLTCRNDFKNQCSTVYMILLRHVRCHARRLTCRMTFKINATCSFGPIVVNGEVVRPSLTVRDLGVIIDPAISFADHVAGLARNCYFQIRQLRSIRRSLTIESCHALVRAMVLSRLDYWRSTWRGPEESTRPALRCHEGCCSTHPGPPSAKSRDQRNPCEAALAWCAIASAIQALLPRVPVSTRFCSPVSGGLLHSCQLNWGTLSASIGCRRVTSRPSHPDCDNWPQGVRGFLSCRVEQSPG